MVKGKGSLVSPPKRGKKKKKKNGTKNVNKKKKKGDESHLKRLRYIKRRFFPLIKRRGLCGASEKEDSEEKVVGSFSLFL